MEDNDKGAGEEFKEQAVRATYKIRGIYEVVAKCKEEGRPQTTLLRM